MQWLSPGAQTPVQTPFTHVWPGQLLVVTQASCWQDCASLPEHRVCPGRQTLEEHCGDGLSLHHPPLSAQFQSVFHCPLSLQFSR
jgi:hypothetical protein